MELVYILLQSITTFSQAAGSNIEIDTDELGQSMRITAIDLDGPDLRDQIESQKSIKRTLTLNEIQIKNIDQWSKARHSEFVQGADPSNTLHDLTTEEEVTTINEDVLTVEYAPAIFKAIRTMDGISDRQLQSSLNPEVNQQQVFKAKESAGKSGSFFFFSSDNQFLVKTMNDSEM